MLVADRLGVIYDPKTLYSEVINLLDATKAELEDDSPVGPWRGQPSRRRFARSLYPQSRPAPFRQLSLGEWAENSLQCLFFKRHTQV